MIDECLGGWMDDKPTIGRGKISGYLKKEAEQTNKQTDVAERE